MDQKYSIQELVRDNQVVNKFMIHTKNEMTKVTYKEETERLQNDLIMKADQTALYELMSNLNANY